MRIPKYVASFDDIIFQNRDEAEVTLSRMFEIRNTYGYVSVADLYDLIGYIGSYEDSKLYWQDLSDARVARGQNGYILVLPRPHYELDRKESTNEMYESKDAMVSHPSHYQSETGLEVIDVIEAFTSDLAGIEATDTGNVLKYMCRWKKKNGLQDLEKAKWYLQHLIDHIEKETN